MSAGRVSRQVGVRAALLGSILLGLPIFLLAISLRSGEAASCTKGVNCYCDRVKGGDLNDPALLMCEDFEAPTLLSTTGVGNGPPYYGPVYDGGSNRGANWYWTQKYGSPVGSNA